MAFPTRWRRRFTAIFILTASGLVPSAAAAQTCEPRLSAVENAMQDGLSDLSRAEDLLEEALSGADQATATDAQTCGFLRGSHEAYLSALEHYRDCETRVDETLAACPDSSWSEISANPALCGARLVEIEARLATMPDDITRFCGD